MNETEQKITFMVECVHVHNLEKSSQNWCMFWMVINKKRQKKIKVQIVSIRRIIIIFNFNNSNLFLENEYNRPLEQI